MCACLVGIGTSFPSLCGEAKRQKAIVEPTKTGADVEPVRRRGVLVLVTLLSSVFYPPYVPMVGSLALLHVMNCVSHTLHSVSGRCTIKLPTMYREE